MQKLYQKSEIWFALVWIIVYVAGTSTADAVSEQIGIPKVVSFPFLAVLCIIAWSWIRQHGLEQKFGLCRSDIPAKRYLFYLPLVLLSSCNLWFGVSFVHPAAETLLYIGSMICVGFLEELIFRGFLFEAMRKDGFKTAVVVSSLTFGFGHLVNLVNGSGAELMATFCQVCYAAAFGFLCVVLFYRGRSLWPCVITHSLVNSLSIFTDEAALSMRSRIFSAVLLTVIAAGYSLLLLKTLPKREV